MDPTKNSTYSTSQATQTTGSKKQEISLSRVILVLVCVCVLAAIVIFGKMYSESPKQVSPKLSEKERIIENLNNSATEEPSLTEKADIIKRLNSVVVPTTNAERQAVIENF